MKSIAIFASGSGTNAENIITYFNGRNIAQVSVLLSDKANAYAIERAKKHGVKAIVFNKEQFKEGGLVDKILSEGNIDYIVLAGFLKVIPSFLIDRYDGRIINIHPSLLPKYGGKGMYGDHIHRAVIEAKEKESGITIHLVNEQIDEGEPVFQKKIEVLSDDTPETLAEKIHVLEYEYFPIIIEKELKKLQ